MGAVPVIFDDRKKQAKKAARAAGQAAMAQQAEAQAAFDEFSEGIKPITTQTLLQQDQAIAAQERNLARQEKMIAQIDPTIIEASQQALKLLRGEESSTLKPMKEQRALQRQKLLNQLREQLGPGAETSSAGIQALTAFDRETSNFLAQTQQGALSQLGGIAGQFRAAGPDMLREASGLSALAGQRFGTQLASSQGLFQARQPLLGSAGAQFTEASIRAQSNMAQSDAMMQGLFQLGGAAIGGALGGGK